MRHRLHRPSQFRWQANCATPTAPPGSAAPNRSSNDAMAPGQRAATAAELRRRIAAASVPFPARIAAGRRLVSAARPGSPGSRRALSALLEAMAECGNRTASASLLHDELLDLARGASFVGSGCASRLTQLTVPQTLAAESLEATDLAAVVVSARIGESRLDHSLRRLLRRHCHLADTVAAALRCDCRVGTAKLLLACWGRPSRARAPNQQSGVGRVLVPRTAARHVRRSRAAAGEDVVIRASRSLPAGTGMCCRQLDVGLTAAASRVAATGRGTGRGMRHCFVASPRDQTAAGRRPPRRCRSPARSSGAGRAARHRRVARQPRDSTARNAHSRAKRRCRSSAKWRTGSAAPRALRTDRRPAQRPGFASWRRRRRANALSSRRRPPALRRSRQQSTASAAAFVSTPMTAIRPADELPRAHCGHISRHTF